MITFKAKDFDYSGNKNRIEGECLSTDTKPTEGIANGSCLIEMDTGDTYAFDETGAGTWRKLSSSGGGGSSLPAVTSDDNGDVLTVVNGAWDKASPSGGGGNFVVTFTLSQDKSTATADKSFEEIKTAYNNGDNVWADVEISGKIRRTGIELVSAWEGDIDTIQFSYIWATISSSSITSLGALTFTMDSNEILVAYGLGGLQ